jgi:hypothetical protein
MKTDIQWIEAEKCWVAEVPNAYYEELKQAKSPISTFKLTANKISGEIEKLRELLRATHLIGENEWSDLDEATNVLPQWFLENSAPSSTQEEAEAWLAHWRTLEPHEKQQAEDDRGWEAANWLYWLSPEMRIWYLVELQPNNCFIFVAPNGDYITGAARWMLKACGYEEIEES